MADALENLAAAAAECTEGGAGAAEAAPAGAKRKRGSKVEVAQRNINSLQHLEEALHQKLQELSGDPKAHTEASKKKIAAVQQKLVKCSGDLDA